MTESTRVFADREALSRAAASFVEERIRDGVAGRGTFSVVLAGGSTPARLYAMLGSTVDLPWEDVHFFIGDERFVPETDPESNQGMIRRTLFADRVISDENLHFVNTMLPDPEAAALAYDADLRTHLGRFSTFDLLLLGMGADGHTLSIFPDTPEPDPQRLASTVVAPPEYPTRHRISMTLRAANLAREALFMIAGADKSAAYHAIRRQRQTLPAGRIQPQERLLWYLDAAAASAS